MQSTHHDAVVTHRHDPADQLRSHQSPTQESPKEPSSPRSRRHAHQWIIQYHDVWSRLTLSSFYEILDDEEDIKPNQYARWLLDCASISMSLVEAATRAAAILRLSTSFDQLPLLTTATENATFLNQYTLSRGFDIHSNYRLSHPAQRLVDLIEASTAPDAPPTVALTACWGCMYASWQAWALCRRRRQSNPIPRRFREIAEFISRNDSIAQLVFSQQILDKLLNTACSQQEYEKAGKTFEEIAKRSCAVLDHTIFMGEGNQVPLCTFYFQLLNLFATLYSFTMNNPPGYPTLTIIPIAASSCKRAFTQQEIRSLEVLDPAEALGPDQILTYQGLRQIREQLPMDIVLNQRTHYQACEMHIPRLAL